MHCFSDTYCGPYILFSKFLPVSHCINWIWEDQVLFLSIRMLTETVIWHDKEGNGDSSFSMLVADGGRDRYEYRYNESKLRSASNKK